MKVAVPRFLHPCLTLKVRREGIEPPNPLIKRSQQRRRRGIHGLAQGADGARWTAADVTALLSPLLSCFGSRDCFRVSDLFRA